MSTHSTYGGYVAPEPEPPTEKRSEVVLYRENGTQGDSIGYRGLVSAGKLVNVAYDNFPKLQAELRELGYEIGPRVKLVFNCQLGVTQNINLSGYFESAEIEAAFMRFVAQLNKYHFYLERFQMDFIRLQND